MFFNRVRLVAFVIFSFILSTLSHSLVIAGVTGDPTVFNAGVWVQHPGVAVGKLFAADSRMITVVGDAHGFLHAWYPNGTEIAGFPKQISNQSQALSGGGVQQTANSAVNSTPALVDINGDGNLEIFVGSGDGWVYGLNNAGNHLPGWPQFTGVSTGDGAYGVHSSPAVADLEGDGNFEVIVGAWSHYIYVWNAENGSISTGWPFNNADTVWSSPALADFDSDGKLEIVIGADSTVPEGGVLRMFRYDGQQVTGWPQFIDQVIWSSPAIGDIDADGSLEIVVGTGHFYASRGEYVNAYEANGAKVTNWPVAIPDPYTNADSRIYSSPALADVDGNGTLEVFVGSLNGYLYAINSNGTIRWSNTPPDDVTQAVNYGMLSSPVVGDIDGDGRMEAVIGGGWHITAFDAQNGTKEAGYTICTCRPDLTGQPMFTWSAPAIADVDGDGVIELLIGNGRKNLTGFSDAGGVRVYNESGSAGTTNLGPTGVSWDIAPWPRFRRSNSSSGSTNDQPASTGGGTSNLVSNAGATPFVFSPNGDNLYDQITFGFNLSAADRIFLEVLDRNGSIVARPINGANLAAGTHTANWNGTTGTGPLANDGMYTFRIRGDAAAAVTGSFGINNTVPEANKSWYLAEGSTVGFEAYVLVQNPNDSPVTVNFTFFRQNGQTILYSETVPARARTTVPIHREAPNLFSVSTGVEASLPILVERAMYFNGNKAAHNTIGATRSSISWHFAANRTFPGDEDFILIVNPSSSSATVTATFYLDNQDPITQTYSVAATSRFTIPVHAVVGNARVSVQLDATVPVVAERAFYIQSRQGGASGVGAVSASQTWYFADGDTTQSGASFDNFETHLEMYNPGTSAATVTVNYMLEDGTLTPKTYAIPARRRLSLNVANEIGANRRFSMEVISNVPIVAERLMFSALDVGDSIGSPTTAYVWNLAEGFTAFGFETWVLISNPGSQTANVTVRFMRQSGANDIFNYTIGPRQRLKVYANPLVPPTSISAQVTSDQPIVVERLMKFANRQGMHQALGVRQ